MNVDNHSDLEKALPFCKVLPHVKHLGPVLHSRPAAFLVRQWLSWVCPGPGQDRVQHFCALVLVQHSPRRTIGCSFLLTTQLRNSYFPMQWWEWGCKPMAAYSLTGCLPSVGRWNIWRKCWSPLCTAHSKRASWGYPWWKFSGAVKCCSPIWQPVSSFPCTPFGSLCGRTK